MQVKVPWKHTCPFTHAINICPAWMASLQSAEIQWRGDNTRLISLKWLQIKCSVTLNAALNHSLCHPGVLVPGSQDAAGSWARASNSRGHRLLRCSFFVFFCSAAPGDGRRLFLEGCVPLGGRPSRGLVCVVVLLGSVEGQPPEERQLIGREWLGQPSRVSSSVLYCEIRF